ncbi:MAG: tetratricopeptide repeat protein [Vampirovibrionales bacterium]
MLSTATPLAPSDISSLLSELFSESLSTTVYELLNDKQTEARLIAFITQNIASGPGAGLLITLAWRQGVRPVITALVKKLENQIEQDLESLARNIKHIPHVGLVLHKLIEFLKQCRSVEEGKQKLSELRQEDLQEMLELQTASMEELVKKFTQATGEQFTSIQSQLEALLKPQPALTLNTTPNSTNYHYGSGRVAFVGREAELCQLEAFLKYDATPHTPTSEGSKLLWWAITGEGGSGKSRLALELCQGKLGMPYRAGFLQQGAELPDEWQPSEPTLVIIDYLPKPKALWEKLSSYAEASKQWQHPVRILILERTVLSLNNPETQPGLNTSKEGLLNIAPISFGNTLGEMCKSVCYAFEPLKLSPLEASRMIALIKTVFSCKRLPIQRYPDDTALLEKLRQIDPTLSRILLALYLADAWATCISDNKPLDITSIDCLLHHMLDKELRRWREIIPDDNQREAYRRLILLGTLTQGCFLDVLYASQEALPTRLGLPENACQNTLSQFLGTSIRNDLLPSMQPDLLGEYFVLTEVLRDKTNHGTHKNFRKQVYQYAWQCPETNIAYFYYLVHRDFPKASLELFKILDQADLNAHAGTHSDQWGRACMVLGSLYYTGTEGFEKDLKKAFVWTEKVAEQGYAKAQFNLGIMYKDGEGTEKNLEQAFDWTTKSAEQGHAKAQDNLSIMYINGEGTTQDLEKAFVWTKKAAEQGHAKAQFNLGVMYEKGEGIEQNLNQAFFWAERSSLQGHIFGQILLSKMYYEGAGTEKNVVRALFWLVRSGEGSPEQREQFFSPHLDAQTQARVIALAEAWQVGNPIPSFEGIEG